MSKSLISHVQAKIQSLREELNAIEYTQKINEIHSENDKARSEACISKIQVLNELLMSYGIQESKEFDPREHAKEFIAFANFAKSYTSKIKVADAWLQWLDTKK